MVLTNHCRECNKDYLKCENCNKTFPTNVTTSPEVAGHDCTEENDKPNTAEAAAAGAAGGLAAGTAGGLAVTAGAPAALGAVGFTGSGVAGGSIAATLQGLLYAGATPAGGWFATCTSAAMGGAMGAAAVTAVAATGGVAVAAGAGYGIYKMVKKHGKKESCPWCKGSNDDRKDEKKSCDDKSFPKQGTSQSLPAEPIDIEKQTVNDISAKEQEEFDRAVAMSLESFKQETNTKEKANEPMNETEDDTQNARQQFLCPVCADLMSPPARIWQCGVGHILCQNCRSHPDIKNCPACRGQFVGRNLAMESMAEIVFK
eukprot:GFUD01037947.1.p1 GENE.GFUD01037947.1~~GFUD01037947.1.p1  ORF type:complete len:315 (+),score=102.02 GFUD01037947.1:94-1038(+)